MTLPWRIAIIDDERSVRSGLSNLLQSEGYATDTFDSAEVFLSHPLALSGASLVIADIKLRGMNGIELARAARALQPNIHIVIISGYGEFEYAQGAIQAGVDDYLLKPVSITKI